MHNLGHTVSSSSRWSDDPRLARHVKLTNLLKYRISRKSSIVNHDIRQVMVHHKACHHIQCADVMGSLSHLCITIMMFSGDVGGQAWHASKNVGQGG